MEWSIDKPAESDEGETEVRAYTAEQMLEQILFELKIANNYLSILTNEEIS